nr:expressed conserved protein [Hymenolepis microstoma]
MAIQHLILIVMAVLSVKADVHDEFPQWDRVHWLVRSTDSITLQCEHSSYYPFNDIVKNAKKVLWILPRDTSYRHLQNSTSNEGFRVNGEEQKFSLMIDKSEMNIPEATKGMYVCAALAKVAPDNTSSHVYAWYYLRWGVGLYTNVPAMNTGSIGEKYYWCFTYAWVSGLVFIVILILLAVTIHFRYKGGPVEESDSESIGPDGLSVDGAKGRRRSSVSSSSSLKKRKGYEDSYSKF